MEIIKLNTAEIAESNAPISFYDEWTSSNFAAGSFVYYQADVYSVAREYVAQESVAAGESEPPNNSKWIDIGAANRFRCIDTHPVRRTQLGAFGILDVEVDFDGLLDRIVVYGMEGTQLTFDAEPNGGGSSLLPGGGVILGLQYDGQYANRKNFIWRFDPGRIGVRAVVKISGLSDPDAGGRDAEGPSVGAIIAGRGAPVGTSTGEIRREYKDLSIAADNGFGIETFTELGIRKTMEAVVNVENDDKDEVLEYLETLGAQTIVADANPATGTLKSSLILMGTVREARMPLASRAQTMTLQVRGVVE